MSESQIALEVSFLLEVSSSLHRVVLYSIYVLFMQVVLGGVESRGFPYVLRIMHYRN